MAHKYADCAECKLKFARIIAEHNAYVARLDVSHTAMRSDPSFAKYCEPVIKLVMEGARESYRTSLMGLINEHPTSLTAIDIGTPRVARK